MLQLIRRAFGLDGRAPNIRTIRGDGKGCAFVFLHGFSAQGKGSWRGFIETLLQDQRLINWDIYEIEMSSSWALDLPFFSVEPGIAILGRNVLSASRSYPLNSYKSVVLLCHSMGGLVAQWAILNGAFQTSLGALALFGTPSAGLKKARFASWWKRQAADMVMGSSFITSLRQRWTEQLSHPPFRLLAIKGDRDDLIPPVSVFADFDESATWVVQGDHSSMLDVKSMSDLTYCLVVEDLLGKPHVRTIHDAAAVALELGDYRAVIDQLMPQSDTLDQSALIQLALALDGVGRGIDALELLEKRGGQLDQSDALSVLGGRLKRTWLAVRDETVFKRAREKYAHALKLARESSDNGQIFYAAINLAFLDLVHTPPNTALPTSVEDNASLAKSAATLSLPGLWREATLGEACLMLGEIDAAVTHYRDALASNPSPREIDSIYQQLVRIAQARYPSKKTTEPLMTLFNPRGSQD